MIDNWIETLKQYKCLSEPDVKELCDKVKEILIEENNVQPVSAPVTVCGDIHGQFYDLKKLFDEGGNIPENKYIFMGDYVDRGYNSVETIEYLFVLKLKYPDRLTLLRGNHESRQICFSYGFYEESNRKYGNVNIWKYFNELFDYLPIAALIEGKIFCVHGGLSPSVSAIDQIRLIYRHQEIPHEGTFCDLLWSDPDNIDTWVTSARGAGFLFGWKVVKEFNHINDLDIVCRAHQLVSEGYKFWFEEKSCLTVWSCPNYCYRCGNVASIMKVDENLSKEFKVFDKAPEGEKVPPPKTIVPYFL